MRYICDILADMRKAHKTRNYSYLPGLIEELQWAANRMEAAIGDLRELKRLRRDASKIRAEIRKLRDTRDSLKDNAS